MKRLSLALLLSVVSAQFDFTSCSSCLNDMTKKYCVSEEGSKCCSLEDQSDGCNDTAETIKCSNAFEKRNAIKTTFVPESEQKSSFYRYHLCPTDSSVCGSRTTLVLGVPSNRSVMTDTGLDLNASLPPGYVCFYQINVLRSAGDDAWMTRFQIEDIKSHRDMLEAHLIVVSSDAADTQSFKDFDIMAPNCDELDNSCIRNVREKGRDFFLGEGDAV